MMFPTWNDALKTALGQQTEKFIEGVIADGDGKLETLMGASFSYLSGPLTDTLGASASLFWKYGRTSA